MASIQADFINPFPTKEPSLVCVPQVEYDRLTKVARQYARLRLNLVRGGVDDHILDLLSDAESAEQATTQRENLRKEGQSNHATITTQLTQNNDSRLSLNQHHAELGSTNHHDRPHEGRMDWYDDETHLEDGSWSTEMAGATHTQDLFNPTAPLHDDPERLITRSIQLLNLPDGTRHRDITSAIRGGMLLDIHLRAKDKTATVSFVREEEAQAFYAYTLKRGLCIRNKGIDIKWADRQFQLRPHVARKIASGATRNLVVRRCDPNHTEQSIRDDLDHIHNLVVIKVEFQNNNCLIHTNSINNAMYARTCMMSRSTYRGSKIEWFADECAEPLSSLALQHDLTTVPSSKKQLNPLANRFKVLDVEYSSLS